MRRLSGQRAAPYAELTGREACTPGCTVTLLKQIPRSASNLDGNEAYRERDNMGNVITRLPNVRESHLFCRPFDCSFLRWQIRGEKTHNADVDGPVVLHAE